MMAYESRRTWSAFAAIVLTVLISADAMSQVDGSKSSPIRTKLENGMAVLIQPVPGVGVVAVESFYWVGFVHDPRDMPQAAHLLEHLMCSAATQSYAPNESMARLNKVGLANAETMPDWTHYDYVAPASELELLLRIEAERMTSIKIDQPILDQEAPRCVAEVDFVERNPKAGMSKFAFMALNQAWSYGREKAKIRSGLESFPVEALQRFHRQFYRPDNMTLVIAGDIDPEAAVELVRKHLGSIENPAEQRPPAADWSRVSKRASVRWDSSVQAVCVAFAPPDDALDRLVLTLWGSTIYRQMTNDKDLRGLVDSFVLPSHMWSVGELPFFVYATVKNGESIDKVEALLTQRIRTLAEAGASRAAIIGYVRQLGAAHRSLDPKSARRSAKSLEKGGRSPEHAMGMVLGQFAINWGIAERFIGEDSAATLAALEALTPERLKTILTSHLSAGRQIVFRLVPEAQEE